MGSFGMNDKAELGRRLFGDSQLGDRREPTTRLGAGLTSSDKQIKQDIFKRVVKMLDLTMLGALDDKEARVQIRETCEALMAQEALPLNMPTRQRIIKEIEDEILGLGPLEQLLADFDDFRVILLLQVGLLKL